MIKKFPQYLSSPLQVLWFEVDEVGIIFLSFLMGLLLEGFFYIGMIIFAYTDCSDNRPVYEYG